MDLIHSIRHSTSILIGKFFDNMKKTIVQLFGNVKKPKALPSLSIYPRDGRAEAFGIPSSQELGPHNR